VPENAVDLLLVTLAVASILLIRLRGYREIAARVRSGQLAARTAALLLVSGIWVLPVVAWAVFSLRRGSFDPPLFALVTAISLAGTAIGVQLAIPFLRDLEPKPRPNPRRELVANHHERKRSVPE
jgi:hypothetical protein